MIHWLLKQLPPELAHTIAKAGMKRGWSAPDAFPYIQERDISLFDIPISNRLGLAAGFDKNAELLDTFEDYGFGWLEIGSITWGGGPGNKKPRLFRVEGWDILNRMGLNGRPASEIVGILEKRPSAKFAVNITKTHNPNIVGDAAIRDVMLTYSLLKHYGIYCCLNISCPNTKEGKTFEEPESLKDLLLGIHSDPQFGNTTKPLVVKLSPTLSDQPEKLSKIISICEENKVAGYETSNTLFQEHPQCGKGGRSGKGVLPKSLQLTHMVRQRTQKVIIGLGGIFTGSEMFLYKLAGADFFQAYNGFVRGPYAGPLFAHRVNSEYTELRRCATQIASTHTST